MEMMMQGRVDRAWCDGEASVSDASSLARSRTTGAYFVPPFKRQRGISQSPPELMLCGRFATRCLKCSL